MFLQLLSQKDWDVDLNIAEAALGTKVTLPLPLGGTVDMSIPAGVSSGSRLRVKGKGCETSDGKKGDFYAVIHIIAPKDIDDEGNILSESSAPWQDRVSNNNPLH